MGILDRIRKLLGRQKKRPEAGQQTAERPSESPPAREQQPTPPQPPSAAAEPAAFEGKGEDAVKLPVKRRILREEIEDPFSDREKEKIFQDGLDLITLFRKGEFGESEALRRQRSMVMKRLKRKKLEPEAVFCRDRSDGQLRAPISI
jgi:hypothetical protein